ncbi:MAG: ribonuclease Y [Bdellovibrionales bacterium CG10_big_fil_rev_8_21_14_0_10_45_34]|nr:MAG: ribonuclease Y [Bdellovibrionales bacterium CG10_big_fil_rev_8_21_14_0_10_45_34]
MLTTIGVLILGVLAGGGLVLLALQIKKKRKRDFAISEADKILNRAKQEARRLEQRAKETEGKVRKNAEVDIKKQKSQLQKAESDYKRLESELQRKIKDKEDEIIARRRKFEDDENRLKIAEKRAQENLQKYDSELEELKKKLEVAAQMTSEQAKQELVQAIRKDAELDAAKAIMQIESETKAEAEKKAKRIISLAVSRYAGEYAAERVVSVVALPSEEMKGRIIGREGRNIRALEAACGVDLIVDDTPEAVVISGFDPVRREVARRALERLMEDGRVHPARIEEVIAKVKEELFQSIKEDGEKACFELGITGVNPEIIKLIGSLKYRTSFTQNNYTHSIEVGFLAGLMAAELDGDIKAARRAGLLHDIGKALDHSVEGSHAVIGAEFAKKHGEREAICHAVRAHHEDEKPQTLLAHLAQAADALSGARPGARRSMMESYVRRLEDLESIANSFDGVIRTFAVQAGREIRVIVEGSKVTDEQSILLSKDIARKIEREMSYPGQIKVTVIREVRSVEHAR